MSASKPLLVEGLSVVYAARQIISGLTLPLIEAGTVTALVGPNGAGKSTILKALAQILPSTGTLRFGAQDLRQVPLQERAGVAGFMPQGLPLAAELTVIESVIVALQAGQEGAGAGRRAMEVLQRVGIAGLAMRPLDRLSGGERQLASLAQAIALSPPLLFLDEPISALDLARQYDVMRLVRTFAREGTAVILVLHDLPLAAYWADKMIVLEGGKLHSAGAPKDVMTADMLQAVYGISAQVKAVGEHLFVVPHDQQPQASNPRDQK